MCVSDIPFAGPIGAVRVVKDQWRVRRQPYSFATATQQPRPGLCRPSDDIVMIEGAADQMPEEEFIKALEFAQPFVARDH